MWVCILNLTLGCGCSKSQQGTHKKKEKFLSFPDPSPFLPTSVSHPHTEFTQTLFQVSQYFPDMPITQHSSSRTEATALRSLQVLILGEWPGIETLSFRSDSATCISITQRQHLVPSLVPYEYQQKNPCDLQTGKTKGMYPESPT